MGGADTEAPVPRKSERAQPCQGIPGGQGQLLPG